MAQYPDTGLLWLIMLCICAASFRIERTWLGRRLAGPTFAISLGILSTSLGLTPRVSPVYEQVASGLVPVAIPLLLFSADLRVIARRTGRLLLMFATACVATVVGAVLAYATVSVPGDAAALTAVNAGTYIGGTMNFVSLSQAFALDPSITAAALASDNVATTFYLVVIGSLPAWRWLALRFEPAGVAAAAAAASDPDAVLPETADQLGLVVIVGLALGIALLGNAAGTQFAASYAPTLVSTTLAVLVATVVPARYLQPRRSFMLGTVLMYIFFVTIGFGVNLEALLAGGLPIFLFCLVLITAHMALLLAAGRALGFSLPEILTASCAAISGPAATAAIAGAQGWNQLVTPGVLLGVLGYVLGNFVGLGVYAILS